MSEPLSPFTEIDIRTGEPVEMYVVVLHPSQAAILREEYCGQNARERYYRQRHLERYNRRARRLGAREISEAPLVAEVGSFGGVRIVED